MKKEVIPHFVSQEMAKHQTRQRRSPRKTERSTQRYVLCLEVSERKKRMARIAGLSSKTESGLSRQSTDIENISNFGELPKLGGRLTAQSAIGCCDSVTFRTTPCFRACQSTKPAIGTNSQILAVRANDVFTGFFTAFC